MNRILQSYRLYFKLLFALSPKASSARAFRLFATPLNQKLRPAETEVMARARKHFTDFAGHRIALYSWELPAGTESRGRVLLVHGWEGNAGSLGGFVDVLNTAGYEVLAFDGIAHHQSGGKQTHVLQFSQLVKQLTESYGPQVLIAHSFGSAASVLALHSMYPAGVDKLVLLSTPDRIEDVITDFTTLMHFSAARKAHLIRYIEQKFGFPVERLTVSDLTPGIRPQVLLVHDSADRILPYTNALSVKKKNPQVQLQTLEKTGHYKMLWDAGVIGSVMEYVNA